MEFIFIAGVFILAIFLGVFDKPRRTARHKKHGKPRQVAAPWTSPPQRAPAEQSSLSGQAAQRRKPFDREATFLDVASKASYKKQRILHEQEFELFIAILSASRKDWRLKKKIRIFPQVNLGEIMTNKYDDNKTAKLNELAQSAINSKRCDLLITCYYGHPRVAIELQGRHHVENHKVMQRDQVKRLAFASAGIELVEVSSNAPIAETLERIRRALAVAYPAATRDRSSNTPGTVSAS